MAELSHVETVGVYKDYGRQRALSNVSLRLAAGQATVLLGDNGAGKSTLLGILSTLSLPSRGQVYYGGQPLSALDPRALRAQLGVLAHEPRCYGDLSARENLRFFARLYRCDGPDGQDGGAGDRHGPAEDRPPGKTKDRPEGAIEALLRRLGLAEAADRPVRTFSRGMVQRLAVGRTLLHRPGLLLLDEPYTGLDRGGVALLTALLGEERRRGAILLIISHDLDAVAPLCDRALLLRRGRVVAEHDYGPGQCSAAALATLYHGPGGGERS